VKVSVTRQGGFLDIDRRVEVEEDQASITETGLTNVVSVDGVTARRVAELATIVARLAAEDRPSGAGEARAYDEMLTEIEIEDAGSVRRLAVVSGADVPAEVWELISAVDRCAAG
jgi:hypothetical protein